MTASKPPFHQLFSLALLSGSGLILEISLTRLLALLYFPPAVFAALALAILGIGIGAALATWQHKLRRDTHLPRYMVAGGLSTLLVLIAIILAAPLAINLLLFLPLIIPYIFIGLTLATIFSGHSANSARLYTADLTGAGLGAILAVGLLELFSPINSILVSVALFALAGSLYRPDNLSRLATSAFALALIAIVSNLWLNWLEIGPSDVATEKPIQETLNEGGVILRADWGSFARTDLIRPGDGSAYRLYIDGAAASIMPPAVGNEYLLRDIGFFPFATGRPQRAFVIGPGGGLDVWFGLQSRTEEIVAVEVNPASVALVEEYRHYNGGLYDHPAVRVIVDEGRSALRRDGTLYDLIFLSQVVTLAAERSGYALSENTIYTIEAFEEYLAHLTPEGQIALKLYDEITLTRALSTALAAFRRQGLSDAEALRHITAFRDPNVTPSIPLLLIRKSPFSADDSLVYGAIAREVGFEPLFLPDALAQPPLDAVQSGERAFSDIVAESERDIAPTTDNRPFFYQFERGIPQTLMPLLVALTVVSLAGSIILIRAQRRIQSPSLRWTPLYFAALGAGFMMVEVAIIQQTRLFLGHPTLAITMTLATLLIGGGIGSYAAGRWIVSRLSNPAGWSGFAVALAIFVWILIWPPLSRNFLGTQGAIRLLAAGISLLPVALSMGIPFPLGLRIVGKAGDRHVALAWTVNGVATVIGSAAAITLAMLIGFHSVLLAGIILYLLAAIVAYFTLTE